jgi:NTP pyrophosphatase (non-canonical NTP hydrolase)
MEELSDSPSLGEIQAHLNTFVASRGWHTRSDTEVFLMFSEEIGELAKEIRKKLSLKGERHNRTNMEEEFADVLNYLLELASRMDVDLEQAYRKKFVKNQTRSWPDEA